MGISIWQLLIILLIVVVLFGTKKLRSIGKDMGGAVKGFREAMGDSNDKTAEGQDQMEHRESGGTDESNRVIEGEVESEPKEKHKV